MPAKMKLKCVHILLCLVLFAAVVQGLKKFVAYKRNINAFQAMQVCNQQGGHLASIESAAEHNQVLAAINRTGYPLHMTYWLIGGSDAGIEGQWMWLGLDKEMKYKNFRVGEPNNDRNQDCLMIVGTPQGNQWDDVWCDHICYGFVCAYYEL